MHERMVVLAVLAGVAGCRKSEPGSTGETKSVIAKVKKEKGAARLPVQGTRRLEGDVQELRASPDGRLLTVLREAVKPRVDGVPPPMRLGELWAVPAEQGEPVKLGHGVTNMPGGWLFTSDSRWLVFSAGWDPSQQTGELYVQDARDLKQERQRVAARAGYFVPSDDGRQLAFIEGGVLHVGALPAGPFRQVAGEVSTAEFSADGRYLYFKRRYSSAGGLYQVALADEAAQPRRLIDQVADYTVLRSGKHVVVTARVTPADRLFQLHVFEVETLKGRKLADDALRFRVARDGSMLAWRTSNLKGDQADVGELWLAPLSGGEARKLGDSVKDFDFSPDGTRFVFRDRYVELPLGGREALPGDEKVEKVGDLHLVELPAGAPRLLYRQCPNFLFAPTGATLAFTARIDRPEVTRRLLLLGQGATEPVALKDWLYEYQFSPRGDALFFRADCLREGRACDVLSVPVTAAKGTLPRKELEGTYGIRFGADGSRVLFAWAHLTDETFDLAVRNLATGTQQTLDQFVQWPALILGPAGERVAYLVHERHRPGLYVAPSP